MERETNELAQSIAQAKAYLDGDESMVTSHTVTVKPAPRFNAVDIKRIRETNHMTQRVLASYLSFSFRTVEAWESGKASPNRSASRLLEMIEKDPRVIELIKA